MNFILLFYLFYLLHLRIINVQFIINTTTVCYNIIRRDTVIAARNICHWQNLNDLSFLIDPDTAGNNDNRIARGSSRLVTPAWR